MDELNNIQVIEESTKKKKYVVISIIGGLLLVLLLIIGYELYSYWMLQETTTGDKSIVTRVNESEYVVVDDENSLFYETVQNSGDKELNIVGNVIKIDESENFFIVENGGKEKKIYINEDSRFVFISDMNSEGVVPNRIGLSNLNEEIVGKKVNINIFETTDDKITAISILVN